MLVTGAVGMLGQDLVQALARAGHQVSAVTHAGLDITDPQAVEQRIGALRPDVVANCAAFTRVDDCEGQPDLAFRVNGLGPGYLAAACAGAGAALLHISTDYVFDGSAGRAHREDDPANPLNQYGASKWAGEERVRAASPRHWIVRTQWLYGAGGPNFVRTILRLASDRDELSVVNDQFGSPTYTADLAGALASLVGSPAYGTYHLTNSGVCSWFEFARAILDLAGLTHVRVKPQLTADLQRPACRPLFSPLDNHRWQAEGRRPLRHWRTALAAFLSGEIPAAKETPQP